MPNLSWPCLGAWLRLGRTGLADAIVASKSSEFSDWSRRGVQRLSCPALHAWSLANNKDHDLSFEQLGRWSSRLEAHAARWGWDDTKADDILPDLCSLM